MSRPSKSVRQGFSIVAALAALAALAGMAGCNSTLDSIIDDPDAHPGDPLMIPGAPEGWGAFHGNPPQFEIGRDRSVYRTGSASVYIRSGGSLVSDNNRAILSQQVRADAFRGKRVRFAGWMQTDKVGDQGVGLWLRSDGVGEQPFDNMTGRRLTGTNDWQYVSIVLQIPEQAIGFSYGVLLLSPGTAWVDDLVMEVVDETVPVTGVVNTIPPQDTVGMALLYDRVPVRPLNFGFEGEIPAAQNPGTVNWVRSASFEFATDDPAVPGTDLEPLRALIGSAPVVALGEATHGTREFFRMKHRMLAWFVKEMGFTHFGIEASLPEALAVDHYVQTGEGDPHRLLSDLRYWTWITSEVLAMIGWMRDWNAAGNQPRVHFTGFDMGFAGVAIDSVTAFASRQGATAGTAVRQAYQCLNQLRSPANSPNPDFDGYGALGGAAQAACRAGIRSVDTLFARNEVAWIATEGREKVVVMRRLARIIDQWEELASTGSDLGYIVRDRAMAENAAWWRETHTPGAKMVLWAHNGHISRNPSTTMGSHLARQYGPAYLPIAQTFGTGTFNAYLVSPTNETLTLQQHTVNGLRDEAIEHVFTATGSDRMIFDARRVHLEPGPATVPLDRLMSIRAIGATFKPTQGETGHQAVLSLRSDFDLIVWFKTATASQLLPSVP